MNTETKTLEQLTTDINMLMDHIDNMGQLIYDVCFVIQLKHPAAYKDILECVINHKAELRRIKDVYGY